MSKTNRLTAEQARKINLSMVETHLDEMMGYIEHARNNGYLSTIVNDEFWVSGYRFSQEHKMAWDEMLKLGYKMKIEDDRNTTYLVVSWAE